MPSIADLHEILNSHEAVESVKMEHDKLLVYLKSELKADDLNSYLFSKGITLTHLVKRKNSLEAQFLELTKNAIAQKN